MPCHAMRCHAMPCDAMPCDATRCDAAVRSAGGLKLGRNHHIQCALGSLLTHSTDLRFCFQVIE